MARRVDVAAKRLLISYDCVLQVAQRRRQLGIARRMNERRRTSRQVEQAQVLSMAKFAVVAGTAFRKRLRFLVDRRLSSLNRTYETVERRLRRRGSMIALEAANPAYETRVFPDHMVKVQGRLVGLIRTYS